MYKQMTEYPRNELVWQGAVLGSIAHAIFVARAPFMAHEQSWDGRNYNVQDSQGSRATISFGNSNEDFVGLFYLDSSFRNQFSSSDSYVLDMQDRLGAIPEDLRHLQNEAAEYMLQEMNGTTIPIVTAVFWSNPDSQTVTSNMPWPEVLKHGGRLVGNQLLPPKDALIKWTKDLALKAFQADLVWRIFERRLATAVEPLQLHPTEKAQILSFSDGESGMNACRESLREIDIILN